MSRETERERQRIERAKPGSHTHGMSVCEMESSPLLCPSPQPHSSYLLSHTSTHPPSPRPAHMASFTSAQRLESGISCPRAVLPALVPLLRGANAAGRPTSARAVLPALVPLPLLEPTTAAAGLLVQLSLLPRTTATLCSTITCREGGLCCVSYRFARRS